MDWAEDVGPQGGKEVPALMKILNGKKTVSCSVLCFKWRKQTNRWKPELPQPGGTLLCFLMLPPPQPQHHPPPLPSFFLLVSAAAGCLGQRRSVAASPFSPNNTITGLNGWKRALGGRRLLMTVDSVIVIVSFWVFFLIKNLVFVSGTYRQTSIFTNVSWALDVAYIWTWWK